MNERTEVGVAPFPPTQSLPPAAPAAADGMQPDMAWRHEQLAGLVDLAEQLATLTDFHAVLDAVAGAVMRTLAPPACAINLLDDSGARLGVSIMRGLDPACAEWWLRAGSQALSMPTTPAHRVLVWPSELQATAPPAVLRVPLALPGQAPVGALDLFTSALTPLSAPDAATLRSITIQAAAAMAASRRRLSEVLAVYTVAQSISGRIDLAHLAKSVLQAVVNLLGGNGGAIILADGQQPDPPSPQIIARLGKSLTPAAADVILAWCTERSTPFTLTSTAPPETTDELLGSGLAAPLWLERKLLGVMVLTYGSVRSFRQSDLWLLSAIGSQVTMALRNAQLYLWSEELAIAEERSRIAREIHDGLAQSLVHKLHKIDLCRRLIGRDDERLRRELDTLEASVRSDIQDVRHSILALRPLDLEQRGLREALQAYIGQFSQDTGVAIAADLASLDNIAPKMQTALFRLVQEALNNIRKHAGATAASVTIAIDLAGELVLRVADNGRGFDIDAALRRQPGQNGIGLRGMIERTVAADGTIEIDSQPGQGTRIEVRLPAR